MKNIRNIIEQKYPPENPNDLWLKDDALYKSTHKGWTPLTAGGDSSTNGVISTTWLELKDKRDVGKLTPGALYRITDYNCTTTQENTQSAGHQFDIVLLALSENKLAEEGWAMEHPTDVYDVTFSDGVTKKCYLYDEENGESYNLVDVETLLGASFNLNGAVEAGIINIDRQDKTIVISPEAGFTVDIVAEENLPYNYFQNSNLSAWKVWYCLDNDTARFAWADDSVDEGSPASINIYDENRDENFECIRDASLDENEYYAWKDSNSNKVFYTTEDSPSTNSDVYAKITNVIEKRGSCSITSFTPAHEGTGLPNGRGVIYRLIDEFNNDCPYDFKNIQKYMPMSAGIYEPNGSPNIWVYTFCLYDEDNTSYKDGSLSVIEVSIDDIYICSGNTYIETCFGAIGEQVLYNDIILGSYSISDETGYFSTNIKLINTQNAVIETSNITIIGSISVGTSSFTTGGFYIGDKKVLTEE